MVTKDQAITIAEAAITGHEGLVGISKVLSWDEIQCRKPVVFWGIGHGNIDWDKCWVAYAEYPDWPLMLRSSTIVVIHKETGAVLYVGSAGDEG